MVSVTTSLCFRTTLGKIGRMDGMTNIMTNLCFWATLVELAVKLHPVTKMPCGQLKILFQVTNLKFLLKSSSLHLNYFVKPAASCCIVSKGSLKLGGLGALYKERQNQYRPVLQMWRYSIEDLYQIFLSKVEFF